WGAPRVHGELLKLGIEVAESTVAKYMVKRPRRPGQSWTTFLRNHASGIAATDLVRGADDRLQAALLSCPSCARPEGARSPRCNDASNGRVGRSADDRGVPVGHGAKIFGARSRRRLRPRREATSARAGHSGSTNGAEVAVAERLRGAFDRLDTTRMH